jgi:glutaredoxin-like protein
LEQLTALSEKIFLKSYNYADNSQLAQQYNVDLAPSLIIAGHERDDVIDYGIRFAGLPSGYEFSSLIQAIILVSRRDSGLKPETRKTLQGVKSPVNLKVFATPTWPYCPQAVVLAHQMAMENPLITAEMISANEFYELSMRYNVSGVPQTTINNGKGVVLGAVPEDDLIQEIGRAIGS